MHNAKACHTLYTNCNIHTLMGIGEFRRWFYCVVHTLSIVVAPSAISPIMLPTRYAIILPALVMSRFPYTVYCNVIVLQIVSVLAVNSGVRVVIDHVS